MVGILRSCLALVLGLVVGVILVFAIETLAKMCYPFLTTIDMADPEAVAEAMDNAPLGAYLILLSAWVIATFAGASLAAYLAQKAPVLHALVIGGLSIVL